VRGKGLNRTVWIVLALIAGSAVADEPFRPTLPDPLLAEAAAFRSYMAEAQTIPTTFKNGLEVEKALEVAGGYHHEQLMRGAVVAGAAAALGEPAFVESLRAIPEDRKPMLADMIARNPWMVVSLAGAPAAAARVEEAVGVPAARLAANGAAVKQFAYDMQKQSWSKEVSPRHADLLKTARTLSETSRKATPEEITAFRALLETPVPGAAAATSAQPPYSRLTLRALAVAAMTALGQSREEHLALLTYAMAEPDSDQCLRMAKLNLFQCLAVAGPRYEDVFCLGQHLVIDTGQCVAKEFVRAPAAPATAATASH
jgi:hypothetical protein